MYKSSAPAQPYYIRNPATVTMKSVIILMCVCAAYAQFNRFNRVQNQRPSQRQTGVPVDNNLGSSQYHYSWRHRNQIWTWSGADAYCRGLGSGWQQISINNGEEFNMVDNALRNQNQKYIWTSASGGNGQFRWGDGNPVTFGWSNTGGSNRAQPDNREGNEFCVACLNNFYNDGTRLHDVSCHHEKPTICERFAR